MKIQLRKWHTFGTLLFAGTGSRQLMFEDIETGNMPAEMLAHLMVDTPEIVTVRKALPSGEAE